MHNESKNTLGSILSFIFSFSMVEARTFICFESSMYVSLSED